MSRLLCFLYGVTFLAAAFAKWDFATDMPSSAVHQRRIPCGTGCKFRFCKDLPGMPTAPQGRTLLLRDSGIASFPFICRPGDRLGKILKTGESIVCPRRAGARPVPISRYLRPCLRPKFNKRYFQVKPINAFPPDPRFGMQRLRSRGMQENCVNNLCVKIPITRYQLLNPVRGGRPRVVRSRDPNDCIAFTTNRALLLIELSWDAGDDLDLRVTEPAPSNVEIFWGNRVSSATKGKLIIDTNVGRCSEAVRGREQIRWTCNTTPLPGTYKIEVRHFNACSDGRDPNWSLSIIANGVRVFSQTGTSSLDSNQLIFSTNYVFNGPLTCRDCACTI